MSSTEDHTHAVRDSIIEYWFGVEPFDNSIYLRRGAMWFNGSEEVDAEIIKRFAPELERAAAGDYDDWSATPTGALAWIILVDQFPRHIFRGTARAYAYGELGRQCCLRALEAGFDRELGRVERSFLYLPLQHSESVEDQRRCVELYEQVERETPSDHWFRPHAEHGVEMARLHARLIVRYKRFPHRNAVLGRASTMFEQMYLDAGGSDFGQSKTEEPASELGAKFVIHRPTLEPGEILFVDGHHPDFPCLSHWPGAEVAPELGHALSTGMALRYVALEPAAAAALLTPFVKVTNDHYDTDGVLAACVLIRPELALRHEDLLLRAAATGDFRTWNGPDALALELTVWALRDAPSSPIAAALAGLPDQGARDEHAHRYVIDHFEELLEDPFEFRSLWAAEFERVLAEIERVDSREGVSVEVHERADLAVISTAQPLGRIAVTHAAGACDRLLLVAAGGAHYRFAYRNESWFMGSRDQTPDRVSLDSLRAALAERERSTRGQWWCTPISEVSAQLGFGDPAAVAHMFGDLRPDQDPPSSLPLATVVDLLEAHLYH